jgi:hypothetical protein
MHGIAPQSASFAHDASTHMPTGSPQRQMDPSWQSVSRTHPYWQTTLGATFPA